MEFFWGTLLLVIGFVVFAILAQVFAKGAKGLKNVAENLEDPDSGFQKGLNWMERKSQELEEDRRVKQAVKQAQREAKQQEK